jgi:hypothetical protein
MKWPITWVWDMSISALLMAMLVLSTLNVVETNSRRHWFGHGMLWALAALTNPALISILPLSLLWIAVKRWRMKKTYVFPLIVTMAAFIGCASPWIIRNELVLGKPAFFRDNFWFEFHLGNYHWSNGMGWIGKHPTENVIQLDFYKRVGEINYIDHFRQESIEFVRTNPGEFLELTYKRFTAFWSGSFFRYKDGDPNSWEWPAYATLSGLAILGFVLALGSRRPGAFLFGTILLCYPVVYYLCYPGPRYRYAIEPELLLLSSLFLCELVRNFRVRLSRLGVAKTEEEYLLEKTAV